MAFGMNMMREIFSTIARRPFTLLLALFALTILAAAWSLGWRSLWTSPDQRGRWLFEQQRYDEAAKVFLNPMWRGAALMKAGVFKEAAQVFGGVDAAEASYDQGNALVMLGKYEDAVARYDRALTLRQDWNDAKINRELARLRAERMKTKGEDAGDQQEGADEIVYDKDKKSAGSENAETAGAPMTDEQIRALWLKRVQTRPADFLRARFAYQLQMAQQKAGPR
jgi:Ca-activated chloride channel family protein